MFESAATGPVEPFLKWAGGKRQLLPQLSALLPATFGTYFEPFVGSGALFFALRPTKARLSDANDELIRTYQAVRDDPSAVISVLRQHKNQREYFNRVRALDPRNLSSAERAARVIYLNRTCFNGLYRVNRRGEFNTPFGSYKNPTICNATSILAASRALKGVQIKTSDYAEAVENARRGDLVYLDPPYVPVSEYSDFKRYHSEPFGAREHERLGEVFNILASRGCYVMLSNSLTPFTLRLYGKWNIHRVSARRLINKNADGRAPITEIIVTSY